MSGSTGKRNHRAQNPKSTIGCNESVIRSGRLGQHARGDEHLQYQDHHVGRAVEEREEKAHFLAVVTRAHRLLEAKVDHRGENRFDHRGGDDERDQLAR